MLLPFSLIVTGCGGLKKGSIFDEKFMKANFAEKIEKSYEFAAPHKVEITDLEGEYTGPYFVEDPETHVYHKYLMYLKKGEKSGYFSVIENKFVLPFDDYYESGSKTLKAPGFELLFLYNCKYDDENVRTSYLYDEYGNKIFIGENGISGDGHGLHLFKEEIEVEEGSDVKTLIKVCKGTQYNNVPIAFAYYTVDAKLKEVLTPEEYYKRNPYVALANINLADYGHPELVCTATSAGGQTRYSIFNTKKEKYISSFSIVNSGNVLTVGDYMYYQVAKTPHEREESYDFYNVAADSKIKVDTYRVNYLTGKESKVKTNFLFGSDPLEVKRVLKDKKGVYSYYYFANTRLIEKDKSLSPVRRSVVVDENLKEVADVAGIDLMNIKQFGDKYWTVKNVVYDSSLKEVGYLPNSNDASSRRIAHEDDRYGLVDYTGKYIVNPVWGSALKLDMGEYFELSDNKVIKIFKVEDEKAVEVASLDIEKYTPFGLTGSVAHILVQEIETSKVKIWDLRTGELTDYPEVGSYDSTWSLGSVSAREGTVTFNGALYRTGDSYCAITSTSSITKSYVSVK